MAVVPQISIRGDRDLDRFFRNFRRNIVRRVRRGVRRVMRLIEKELRKNLSLVDHSLDDLKRLDHPYARRHGTIQIHTEAPWKVHKQSGRLLNAIRAAEIVQFSAPNITGPATRLLRQRGTGLEGSSGPVRLASKTLGAVVFIDTILAPHARWILTGTSRMLARDYIGATVKAVFPKAKQIMVEAMEAEMKAGGVSKRILTARGVPRNPNINLRM